MKNLMLSMTIALLTTLSCFANVEPIIGEERFVIEEINFEMSAELKDMYQIDITYNTIGDDITMSMFGDIKLLQVFSQDGSLEFQLPILSNKFTLDLNDFNLGEYQIHLLLENDEVISSSFHK